MHYSARSFIGRSSGSFWAQYWENEPDDRSLFATHGHLFGLISIQTSNPAADPSLIGHQLIDSINNNYFLPSHQPKLSQLEYAINQSISTINDSSVQVSLVLAVTDEQKLSLVTYNQATVCLRRNSSISRLLTSAEGELLALAGPLQPNDQVLLSTSKFIDSFGWDRVKSNLFLPRIQDIEESFLNSMYSKPDQTGLAAAHLTIHFDDDNLAVNSAPPTPAPAAPTPVINYQPPVTNFSNPSTYVSHHDTGTVTKRRHFNIVFAILVLAGLVGISIYGYRRNQIAKTEQIYQEYKKTVSDKVSSARAVRNLNLDSALTLAKEAKEVASKMSLLKIHSDEVSDFQKQINDILALTGSSENFNPPVLYDTSLVHSNPSYTQIVFVKNILYLLDPSTGRIDQVDPSKKSTAVIANYDSLKSAYSLAENNGSLYLLKDKKVYLVGKNELTAKIDLESELKDFSRGLIQMWNGAVYLLSFDTSGTAGFYKFNSNSSGFGAGTAWLKDSVSLPSSPTSFAINGSVWIIGSSGQLTPYTRGAKDQFKLNSSSAFTKTDHLVTSLDSELIAFTDGDSQIYVYRKNGQSDARYNLGSRKILSLALDAANNQILALCSDQKIYKIAL